MQNILYILVVLLSNYIWSIISIRLHSVLLHILLLFSLRKSSRRTLARPTCSVALCSGRVRASCTYDIMTRRRRRRRRKDPAQVKCALARRLVTPRYNSGV